MTDFQWMPGRDLNAKKKEAAIRFARVAYEETPNDILVLYNSGRLCGCAWVNERKIKVPEPTTRRRLHIYLHEVAHVVLNHNRKKPRHVEELEAEQWATATMRKHGIPVPRKTLKGSKAHIRRAIRKAYKRGAKKIDKNAANYADLPILRNALKQFFG
jgi:hypothetical protein